MKTIKTAAGVFKVGHDGRVAFEKGFCATGEGGGNDNSCGGKPGASGGKPASKPSPRPKPSGVLASKGPADGEAREHWANARKLAREALRKARENHHTEHEEEHGKEESHHKQQAQEAGGVLASKGPAKGQTREEWADERKLAREKLRHHKEEAAYRKRARQHHGKEKLIQKKKLSKAGRRTTRR